MTKLLKFLSPKLLCLTIFFNTDMRALIRVLFSLAKYTKYAVFCGYRPLETQLCTQKCSPQLCSTFFYTAVEIVARQNMLFLTLVNFFNTAERA